MKDLVAELASCRVETVAMLRGLSEPLVGCPEYTRLGQIMIGEHVHTSFYHDQLRRTIVAVREGDDGPTGDAASLQRM